MVQMVYQRLGLRALGALAVVWFLRYIFSAGKTRTLSSEIAAANVFERITIGTPLGSSSLDPQKYPFLQSRIGRDDREDLFDLDIAAGMEDFWIRFQLPFATDPETVHLDEQLIKATVEELLAFNGWAAAACTTLTRPFAARKDDSYSDLSQDGRLYYFALVVHTADHFFIDQLAAIVQISKKLGPQSIFVSIVDYASVDSIPFLSDLSEAVMILLGIPFRIRSVPPMTEDPAASYYPLEEAYTRNLALEPLYELYERRKVAFSRVIWLKGFTCPNDLLETLRLSFINSATMVCSMDWKEHNGFFIYNDRWRTRDLDGNLFRGSKSTSTLDEAPPRHRVSADRYNQHLPFQVFCCESGSHVVDPYKTYYAGIKYRSSVSGVLNISSAEEGKSSAWTEGPCMDSSQMHFCRDIWLSAAKHGVKSVALQAYKLQKSGKPRGLSEEMEEVIRVVAPNFAAPVQPGAKPPNQDPAREKVGIMLDLAKGGFEVDPTADKAGKGSSKVEQGDVDLVDDNAHLPQADFDGTDGVGAARDINAGAEAAHAEQPPAEAKDDVAVGGKPLPKGQNKRALEKRQVPEEPAPALEAVANKPANEPADGRTVAAQEEDEYEDGSSGLFSSNSAIGNLPNSAFEPARILVNPQCITTYAGVSHTRLALDLFGPGDDIEPTKEEGGKYHFDDWESAPNAFVCQEMRTTGGRISSKQQRRTGFQIGRTLRAGWRPGDYV